MNLHKIVSTAIGSVNPFIMGTIQVSTGYTTLPNRSRAPSYAAPFEASMQVQALTYSDLKQIDGLNLNGTRRAIYLNGKYDGVVRSELKGGDLITLTTGANAGTWLVAQVLEQWPDWCKVVCTLQQNP